MNILVEGRQIELSSKYPVVIQLPHPLRVFDLIYDIETDCNDANISIMFSPLPEKEITLTGKNKYTGNFCNLSANYAVEQVIFNSDLAIKIRLKLWY